MIPLDDQLRPTWLFGRPSTKDVTALAITNRVTSQTTTDRPSAW